MVSRLWGVARLARFSNRGELEPMRAQKVLARDFQFYFADLDNIILVQCNEDESVTIRSTRDNCSEERKVFFIRKLAIEGFIPDAYQWFSGPTDGSNGLSWVKDYSWLEPQQANVLRKSNRFMGRLLVSACVLWVAMMRILLVSHHPPASAIQQTKNSAIAALGDPSAAHMQKGAPSLLVPR